MLLDGTETIHTESEVVSSSNYSASVSDLDIALKLNKQINDLLIIQISLVHST